MHASRSLSLILLSSLVLAIAVACGGEEAAPAIDTTPIVGLMEIPISHRNDGPPPADALRIEANQTELRLDSVPIYTLEGGRIPAAEVTPEGPTKLRVAIQAAPPRTRASLTLHAMVKYGTLARTVQALVGAGYREISIAVRPLSTTGAPPAAASWIALSSPQVAAGGALPLDPAAYGGATRPWSDFTAHWSESYDACRAGHYIDCDPSPLATPPDGMLQLVLWARGQGMQLRWNRVGAEPVVDPAVAAATGPAMIEGVRAEAPNAGEELPPTPIDTGAFAFRADVATTAESAITGVTRPVCGAQACQVVIEADEETPVTRILSFYGAAFPNGSTAPQLILRLPAPH